MIPMGVYFQNFSSFFFKRLQEAFKLINSEPIIYNNQQHLFLDLMNSRTRYPLCRQIQVQQELYLQKQSGLFELFDKLQTFPLFSIPQNSIVVDLDNITFGPGRYSIRFHQKEDFYFKIVYYCILHFIFEKAYNRSNNEAYQRLLNYIFAHQIILNHPLLQLTQQQIKIYLVKFLHLMETAKSKRKIVVEELNNLPQISILLVALAKQVSGHSEIRFQQNARSIESNIAAAIGIEFDLLSCELLLFGSEYQVSIRHFDQSCEFSVTHQTPETVQRIKEEFYLAESAYFREERGQQTGSEELSFLQNIRKIGSSGRLLKRETMKSIEWVESEDEEDDCFDPQKTKGSQIKQQVEASLAKQNAKTDLLRAQDQTVYDDFPFLSFERPRVLNFHEIIKQETEVKAPDDLQTTVHSTTFQSTISRMPTRHKAHQTSLHSQTYSFSFLRNMPISKSTREIKTHRFDLGKTRKNSKERRVPTFILNRAKEKTAKQQISHRKTTEQLMTSLPKIPKITFIYSSK